MQCDDTDDDLRSIDDIIATFDNDLMADDHGHPREDDLDEIRDEVQQVHANLNRFVWLIIAFAIFWYVWH